MMTAAALFFHHHHVAVEISQKCARDCPLMSRRHRRRFPQFGFCRYHLSSAAHLA